MIANIIVLIALVSIAFFFALYALYCFVFRFPKRSHPDAEKIPESIFYKSHRQQMLDCIKEMRNTPSEEIYISVKDGCKLFGRFYHIKEGAPIMIFFHGYHGVAEWDGFGSFKVCKECGINILTVDERAHGKSEGKDITFGVNEKHDCKLWIDYVLERFGRETKIILSGLSMGAATVILYAAMGLSANVRGIISDCAYSESSTIIKETIKNMNLPVRPLYFLINLSARIFGKLNLEKVLPMKAVATFDIPILFIHGEKDSVVPLAMGDELFNSCKSVKERLIIKGADHANCAMVDYATYSNQVKKFLELYV